MSQWYEGNGLALIKKKTIIALNFYKRWVTQLFPIVLAGRNKLIHERVNPQTILEPTSAMISVGMDRLM